MRYVVGVDGGGTKTAAAVVGDDLGVIGSGVAGPSNYRSVGMEASSGNIAEAISRALAAAQITLDALDAICLCLAGFDTELDLPVPQRAIALLSFRGPVIFENDVVGAWAAVTGGEPGIVTIAGTGATSLGMSERGEFWRTDGWDYVLGDAGSGYRIGLDGIHEAMKMLDGRREPTILLRQLAECYGIDDAPAMRRLADSGSLGKLRIADFARHVSEAADEGDPVAREILGRASSDIAMSIEAIVRRLEMRNDAFPIGIVGSVFKSRWALEPLRPRIATMAPRATLSAPLYPPEVGAALTARRRLANQDLDSWTLGLGKRQIRRTLKISELHLGN
ncbi:MAG TPA: BadF/BadG/BcrA/BcrD ATPase family protein [Ktedonobacterales bacterium]|nr:BadF/BadG/BcrA/BcrD ATPase family protein [Ktedonobacterales bacterium]